MSFVIYQRFSDIPTDCLLHWIFQDAIIECGLLVYIYEVYINNQIISLQKSILGVLQYITWHMLEGNQKKKLCSLHFDIAINLMRYSEMRNNEVIESGADYNFNEPCEKVKEQWAQDCSMKRLKIILWLTECIMFQAKVQNI